MRTVLILMVLTLASCGGSKARVDSELRTLEQELPTLEAALDSASEHTETVLRTHNRFLLQDWYSRLPEDQKEQFTVVGSELSALESDLDTATESTERIKDSTKSIGNDLPNLQDVPGFFGGTWNILEKGFAALIAILALILLIRLSPVLMNLLTRKTTIPKKTLEFSTNNLAAALKSLESNQVTNGRIGVERALTAIIEQKGKK